MASALVATVVALSVLAVDAPPTEAKLVVRVITVHETRHKDLRKNPTKPQFGGGNPDAKGRLAVTIEITGDAAARAEKYGFIQVTKAEDDQGKALKPREGFGMNFNPHDRLVDVDRDAMFFGEEEKPKDKLRVTLHFDAPARSSKALKTLTGTLKLFVFQERKEVLVTDILSMQGKTIENELLKSAGLNIKVAKVNEKTKAVTFETTGDQDSLLGLSLVDAAGKEINVMLMTTTSGGQTSRSLQPEKSAPADARLKLTIGIGQETVEVPFSFTDVPLP